MAQLVKNPPATRETWVWSLGWEGLPTPVFWPGEFHGLHSPWGRRESDMTERLSLSVSVLYLTIAVIEQTAKPILKSHFDTGFRSSHDYTWKFTWYFQSPLLFKNHNTKSCGMTKYQLCLEAGAKSTLVLMIHNKQAKSEASSGWAPLNRVQTNLIIASTNTPKLRSTLVFS